MGVWRRLIARLLHTLRPSRGDRDAAREYEAHLALVEDDLVRRGRSPDDARRSARLVVGPPVATMAAHREARGFPLLLDAGRDTRHAVAMLRRAQIGSAHV